MTDINENKEISLEKKLGMLDSIIEELEGENISLEDAFNSYKRGIELVRECNESIDRVEKKVQLLSDNGETVDFE